MEKAKKVLNVAGNVLFVALLCVMLVVVGFVVKGKLDGGNPSIAGYQLMAVLSGSMEPTFDTGSMIVVEPVKTEGIETGDIITFKQKGVADNKERVITHRVIAVSSGANGQLQFTTKGDNNGSKDLEPVISSNVIGREVFDIPYAGYLSEFIKTKKGLMLFIIIPGLLIIGTELKKLWDFASEYDRKQKEEKALVAPNHD